MASDFDFVDSFCDRADTYALNKKWTGTTGFSAVFASVGRFPGQKSHQVGGLTGLLLDYGGSTIRGASGFTGKFGIGVAVKVSASQGIFGGASVFSTVPVNAPGGGVTFNLVFTKDGRLAIEHSGVGIIEGTYTDPSVSLHVGVFYFIEWEMTLHESSDDLIPHTFDTRIYIEGVEVLNASLISLDVPSLPGNRYINPSLIRFNAGQEAGFVTEYCDFYFRTAGIFGAGLRVLCQHPEADFITQFDEPSVGTHFSKVDEALLDTTDYIRSLAFPQKDQFDLEDLPASVPSGRVLKMVQFEYFVEGSDGGDLAFSKHILTRGADVRSPNIGLTGFYSLFVHDSDPFSASTYLSNEFNGDVAGVVVET